MPNEIESLNTDRGAEIHFYERGFNHPSFSFSSSSYEISLLNKRLPESRYYLINGASYVLTSFSTLVSSKGIKINYKLRPVQLGKEIIIEKGSSYFLVDRNNQRYEITAIKVPSADF